MSRIEETRGHTPVVFHYRKWNLEGGVKRMEEERNRDVR